MKGFRLYMLRWLDVDVHRRPHVTDLLVRIRALPSIVPLVEVVTAAVAELESRFAGVSRPPGHEPEDLPGTVRHLDSIFELLAVLRVALEELRSHTVALHVEALGETDPDPGPSSSPLSRGRSHQDPSFPSFPGRSPRPRPTAASSEGSEDAA